jgi:predicted enzyme related to lactoylglutathione lyase
MANLFNWVEIPTTDMARAKSFYQTILGVEKELETQDLERRQPCRSLVSRINRSR